jgi:isoleucyl-tRNA synthetase
LALQAIEKDVTFVPDWGRNRMRGMLESRPDWCISRQRAWGLPIPAFVREDGSMFMTAASVRAVAKVFAQRGSDAWFTEPTEKLLEHYESAGDPDAPSEVKCGASPAASWRKAYDIFDVWFESGSSWHAVMRQGEQGYPIDLYLEGSDQHRGWFQTSLLPALGATGTAPFRTLLTHGFMVDKDGRKMSKSLGNALNVDDLLKDHGADVCRWWVSSLAYENDIKVDPAFFALAGESYRKVRNTLRFLLSNLYDFDPPPRFVDPAPRSLDAWALAEGAAVQAGVLAAYEAYQFRAANQLLYDFCNETLSAVYCAAVKDRLYCDRADSPRRRSTQAVMWRLADMLSALLAPILPHTADEAWRALRREESGSVHMQSHALLRFEADPAWSDIMRERAAWLKAIEDARQQMGIDNPLDCGLRVAVAPAPGGLAEFDRRDLADFCGISRFEIVSSAAKPTVVDLRYEARCERSWKRDGTVKPRGDGGVLCDRCAEAVGAM